MKPDFRFIEWQDIEKYCSSIYSQMCCEGYKPEAIIGLLRGGVVPSRIFSDYFNILLDFFALDVKMYENIGIARDKPDIRSFYGDVKGKKILIIDDIWDSGETMNSVLNYLDEEDITTATLFWKETANDGPGYYAEVAKDKEWIVFPWEKQEFGREVSIR